MINEYFVRITPTGVLSYEDITTSLSSIGIDKWFIAYEEASRPHYHLCLWTERSVENLRYQIKKHINGQVYISGKQIQDRVKAIAYCMKDGNYRQNNVNMLEVIMAKQISTPKIKFDDELKKIVDSDLSTRDIVSSLIDLHIKCNRKIYRQHIKALMDLIRARKDRTFREDLINYFLDN